LNNVNKDKQPPSKESELKRTHNRTSRK